MASITEVLNRVSAGGDISCSFLLFAMIFSFLGKGKKHLYIQNLAGLLLKKLGQNKCKASEA